jgi:hypothetical protein
MPGAGTAARRYKPRVTGRLRSHLDGRGTAGCRSVALGCLLGATLNLRHPVAVTTHVELDRVDYDTVGGAVACIARQIAPDSAVAISALCRDDDPAGVAAAVKAADLGGLPIWTCDRAGIAGAAGRTPPRRDRGVPVNRRRPGQAGEKVIRRRHAEHLAQAGYSGTSPKRGARTTTPSVPARAGTLVGPVDSDRTYRLTRAALACDGERICPVAPLRFCR